MFKLQVKLEVLRELCNISETIVKEVRLKITKESMVIKAAEKSKVALLHLSYSNKVYEEFNGEDSEIAFEIDKFKTVLSLGKSGQSVELQFDDKENRLVIILVGSGIVRRMTLLDKSSIEERKIPNIAPPNWINLKTSDLMQGIRGTTTISETIRITLNGKFLNMHSEDKGDTIDINIPFESWIKSDVKDEQSVSDYPLKFFEDIVKVISGNEQCALFIQSDFPLKLEFNLAGGAGLGRFYLAPQVDETKSQAVKVEEEKKDG